MLGTRLLLVSKGGSALLCFLCPKLHALSFPTSVYCVQDQEPKKETLESQASSLCSVRGHAYGWYHPHSFWNAVPSVTLTVTQRPSGGACLQTSPWNVMAPVDSSSYLCCPTLSVVCLHLCSGYKYMNFWPIPLLVTFVAGALSWAPNTLSLPGQEKGEDANLGNNREETPFSQWYRYTIFLRAVRQQTGWERLLAAGNGG